MEVFADKYKFIPKCKPLYAKPYWVNDYKVNFPTIKTILEDKLFSDEEKLKIKKCRFYTKFCLHKGISWKELNWYFQILGYVCRNCINTPTTSINNNCWFI